MSINTNNSSKRSGFYYDWQLSNPLLTATLHTNTYLIDVGGNALQPGENPYEKKGKFNWGLWIPIKNKDKEDPSKGKVYCLEPLTNSYSLVHDRNPSACYRAKPLITSVLNEDFQVEIGNAWSDNGGQTGIESAFNSLKTLSPYKQETAGALKKLGESIKTNFGKNDGKGFANWSGDKLEQLGKIMESGSDSLNSTLIQQGTRFSYYGGTSTNIGNLNMRFTLFADWIWDDKESDWVFKTVHDQLREIYPYTIGKYYPLNLDLAEKNILGDEHKTEAEFIDKKLGEFFGWQQPPSGFRADMRSLDICQQGTLRLVLGGYYTAENLLINGMSVNFSKTMTKIPPTKFRAGSGNGYGTTLFNYTTYDDEKKTSIENEKEIYGIDKRSIATDVNASSGYLTPLYADVTITLRPASSYSDNTIINFSSNAGRGYINKEMEKMRRDLIDDQKRKKKAAEAERNKIMGDLNSDSYRNSFSNAFTTTPPPSIKYHPAEK